MGYYERVSVRPPPSGIPRRVFIVLFIVVAVFLIWAIGGQIVWFWLNVREFGELFIRPFYFEFLGGVILSTIAFVRVDFKNRRSLTWWFIRLFLRATRSRGDVLTIPPEYLDFSYFRLSRTNFIAWQVTKVLFGITVFPNVIFGMSIHAMLNGWDSGISQLPRIFTLPFLIPPLSMEYAQQNVVPLIPSLTLLVGPILTVIGVRLIILIGLTQLIKVGSSIFAQSTEPSQPIKWPVATVEALISLALFWSAFNLFFPSYIDYNTRYVIGGVLAAGVLFALFSYFDRSRRRRMLSMTRRTILLRVASVLIIVLLVGSIVAVQNSIADARKVEWMGPYTAQEISVNRYLAEIDKIDEVPYNFSLVRVPPEHIDAYVNENGELLDKIRLWDWNAAFAKLKPEIGLIPYVDFEDSDILRFNGTLYWSASMKPILPETVEAGNIWFVEHMYYTNVPNGFLLLDGHEGTIVDSSNFFNQRRIYYGEGGLFRETWAAYPLGSGRSLEVGDILYNGTGGIDLPPPLSWIFDSTFLVSFPDATIHVLRYRDVIERMKLLYPYFVYDFGGSSIDIYPVTDGKNSYWLIPLIVALDGREVPWSRGNPLMRFVGYALVDIYNGDIHLIIFGDDYFSELFKTSYRDYVTTDVPRWLRNQTRYPEELFEWRVGMYNFYHVTDPATFIVAKEFFEVPPNLDTYFVFAKPPGFEREEFVGILSLQLRGALGRNLAGYMIVRNDYPNLGQMIFYEVPLTSSTKLLGPTAVVEALQKDEVYAQRKTLLSSAGGVREGDKILYRIGDHDVYFIPVYTARAGGVITQLGLVAAVGATFTGETFIGLGSTAREAFKAYLTQIAGIKEAPLIQEKSPQERVERVDDLFSERGLTVVEPRALNPHVSFLEGNSTYISEDQWNGTHSLVSSFIDEWADEAVGDRVMKWREDSAVNYGFLVNVGGVVELHYITVSFE